jgi:hypothetical protein
VVTASAGATIRDGLVRSLITTVVAAIAAGCGVPVAGLAPPAVPLAAGERIVEASGGQVLGATLPPRGEGVLPPPAGQRSLAVSLRLSRVTGETLTFGLGTLALQDDIRLWLALLGLERQSTRWPRLAGYVRTLLGGFAVEDAERPGPAGVLYLVFDVGGHLRVPFAGGGLVLSQGVGTGGFLSLHFSGSVALDLALGALHLVPEVRWDPYVLFAADGDVGGSVSLLVTAGVRF